ncbi:DUF418 domain-containing protein [Sphingomonas sp. MMS12-HWE2-04]|uniref:DUF418 domain-containing protein n=1 Tax=Sphingomonas sp. MMS12-HWE2-04 TaxID=3234199 RepID=UPI00384A8B5A
MSQPPATLAPVRGKARIDVLDILRGLAILGIFYINVPYMAAPVWQFSADIRSVGWSGADQSAWAAINLLVAGTQRCLLQFLFGAGMMVMARRAMEPEGPVAVADLYYRRNLWLLAFGLFDVFFLLWPGDILHIYALAALFLFPFRRLGPRVLLALGLGWAVLFTIGIPEHGAIQYVERSRLTAEATTAMAHQRDGVALSQGDRAALADWQQIAAQAKPGAETVRLMAREQKAHAGGLLPYAAEAWRYWEYLAQQWLVWDVIEAFCTMLIGVALWKWGVIQGQRSARFYWGLLLVGYGFGFAARGVGIAETFAFDAMPRSLWVTGELARLAIGAGHLAAVNLLVRARFGAVLLAPFKAAGRMAFSLYFLQQFVGKYILFAPWGLLGWGTFGWAAMAGIATVGIAVQLVIANLWFRGFVSGPLEWLWRSLAYVKVQPLLRTAEA